MLHRLSVFSTKVRNDDALSCDCSNAGLRRFGDRYERVFSGKNDCLSANNAPQTLDRQYQKSGLVKIQTALSTLAYMLESSMSGTNNPANHYSSLVPLGTRCVHAELSQEHASLSCRNDLLPASAWLRCHSIYVVIDSAP